MNGTSDLVAAFRREIETTPISELPSIRGKLAELEAEVLHRLLMPPTGTTANGRQSPGRDAADEGELLTVGEVADRLKVSEKTVRNRQHELGCVRVGRSVRFPRSSVEAFVRRRTLRAR